METMFDYSGLDKDQKSGIVVIGGSYAFIAVKKKEDGYYLQYVISEIKDEKVEELIQWEQKISWEYSHKKLWFQIKFFETGQSRFALSQDGVTYNEVTDDYLSSGAMWVGAKIGLFALDEKVPESNGYVDVEYVRFAKREE
jgi:hypothetical protein